ncbi:uncharacterized protein J4E79_001639 [Alternaria viburni]|uniref:uncharacterized protein n=1 Tax=Alternaria viburni TaxID=566460 RepID=UPI0020C563F6|nr:uncharacterized protein J4E79_001639 [Alternaria viburni]KAI4669594.1 hypothetical protein J4E79_001639 [Alternaria viburni]
MEVGKFSASQSLLPGGAAAEPPATESKKAAVNDLALAELAVTDCELLSAKQTLLILNEAVVMEKGEHPAGYTSQTDETVAEPPATAKKEANVLTLTCRYATAWNEEMGIKSLNARKWRREDVERVVDKKIVWVTGKRGESWGTEVLGPLALLY